MGYHLVRLITDYADEFDIVETMVFRHSSNLQLLEKMIDDGGEAAEGLELYFGTNEFIHYQDVVKGITISTIEKHEFDVLSNYLQNGTGLISQAIYAFSRV